MKLIMIRHGEPNYAQDTLTQKGKREAEILAEWVKKLDVKAFYCSPLRRARETAAPSLRAMGREAEILPWLEEFPGYTFDVKTGEKRILWDQLPSYWTKEPKFYNRDTWADTPLIQMGNSESMYYRVCTGLDQLLEKHGYCRDGNIYKAIRSNRDTIVLFCHFAVTAIMMAHLLGISPMITLHNFVALPTSVTTFVTEEREEFVASFRCCGFGDLTHLALADEPPSFFARFCETFDCKEECH